MDSGNVVFVLKAGIKRLSFSGLSFIAVYIIHGCLICLLQGGPLAAGRAVLSGKADAER